MRLRRLSFIAGWAAVALLAVAGFAAFGTSGSTPANPGFDAAAASLGHTAGAYAGLTFVMLADDPHPSATDVNRPPATEETTALDDRQEQADSRPEDESASTGTIASPASGWLSQVQVRALVSKYFAAEDVNQAVRVAWCESRFDPNSVNLRTGAVGLFQHLPKYWADRAENAGFPGADPADPEASTAAAAWAVYDGGGWDVFACRG